MISNTNSKTSTAAAHNAQLTGRTESNRAPIANMPAAVLAPQRASIAAGVASRVAASITLPKGIVFFDTNALSSQYFHAMVYGETNSRKTAVAAQFGTPEEVRIILTRRTEQVRTLEGLAYKGASVETEEQLSALLLHPEVAWTDPTWVNNPNRTLILDDATEAINILLEGFSVIDGREVRNRMRTYDAAGHQLRTLIKRAFKANQHFIATALAKVKENRITGNEQVMPDLPPSMGEMLKTEFEYCLYIKSATWMFLTNKAYQTVKDRDEITGREEEFKREIFAKSKTPLKYKAAQILQLEEKMDLRDVWRKISNAEATFKAKAGGK